MQRQLAHWLEGWGSAQSLSEAAGMPQTCSAQDDSLHPFCQPVSVTVTVQQHIRDSCIRVGLCFAVALTRQHLNLSVIGA